MADAVSETAWYLYIIECADASLYCGITTDVARRLSEHQQGAPKGAKYLRGRGPLSVVFQAKVGDKSRALKLELAVKALSKKHKSKLVSQRLKLEELLPDL